MSATRRVGLDDKDFSFPRSSVGTNTDLFSDPGKIHFLPYFSCREVVVKTLAFFLFFIFYFFIPLLPPSSHRSAVGPSDFRSADSRFPRSKRGNEY